MWANLLVVFVFSVAYSEVCCKVVKDTKPKISEDKLKEIASIRAELNEAFERDIDMKTAGALDIIVQPDWTKNKSEVAKYAKVVVNENALKAAAEIREEIQNAVNKGFYARNMSNVNVTEADHFLGLKFRSKNILAKMGANEKHDPEADDVGDAYAQDRSEDGEANVVESGALIDSIDIEKLQRLEVDKRRSHEVLVLRRIVEDMSFDLGVGVREWEHFMHNGNEYFLGLREVDLVVVQKDEMTYEKTHIIHAGVPISCLESFTYRNKETAVQEGVALIGVKDMVFWFHVDSDQAYWEWSTGLPVEAMRYFQINKRNYITISSAGRSSLNIYEFDMNSKEFWIVQKIQLEYLALEIMLLDTGRDMVLGVVQNDFAVVFAFNPNNVAETHIKFELKDTFQSEGILSMSGFQMGGYSYLAIGGHKPQILQYVNGNFVPKTIFGQNFGLVERFLPVPARTYRDDLILLIQHRVEFETHGLVVLDALIWDGDAFEAVLPPPCLIDNQTFAHGVGCMLDINRDSGIKGSTVLRRNNAVFVIVPRNNAESGLFELQTELLAKNSELYDLREIFAFLKDWTKDQDDIVEEALKFLKQANMGITDQPEYSSIASLRAPELIVNGEIGKIYVNNEELTEDDLRVDLNDLLNEIERLSLALEYESGLRRTRREVSFDSLEIDDVEVEELTLQQLNGEEVFVKDAELSFQGTVQFEELVVLDEVLENTARTLEKNTIEVLSDLEFEYINGEAWSDLMSNVVFVDRPLQIDELNIDGGALVQGQLTINNLNGLKFPEEYLWIDQPGETIINGSKYFLGNLHVDVVETMDLVNGVNPSSLITLHEEQVISGTTTFSELEVRSTFGVNGTIQGKGLSDFLMNPSLMQSNLIHASCTFQHLEVKGDIIVTDTYNHHDFEALLQDVVYKPTFSEEQIIIRSQKTFDHVNFNSDIELKDSSLDGIPLTDFVTKNTEQDLFWQEISGSVYFHNLSLTGDYDTVDIGKLMRESLRTSQDIELADTVKFVDDIWAESFDILSSLNDETHFLTLQDELQLEEATFTELVADTVITDCHITGNGSLNGVNLNGVYNPPEIVVDELILKSGLDVELLNDIDTELFLSSLGKIDDIPGLILEGKAFIDNIHIDGDVLVNQLNGYSFDEDIQANVVWLNRANILQGSLEFEEPVVITGALEVMGLCNEVDFPSFVEDMAFKSEGPILFTGAKQFVSDVHLRDNAVVTNINDLPFTMVATKKGSTTLHGTVYFNGDIYIDHLEVGTILNDYVIKDLEETVRYDEYLQTFVLLGQVNFAGHVQVADINIGGQLNSLGNVKEFFESIVYKNNIFLLKGRKTFTGNVTLENGAYVNYLNGYNVIHLMKNIVYVNDLEPIAISVPVIFKDAVRARNVNIRSSLTTTNLMGCSLKDWIEDTVRIDMNAEFESLHFDSDVLNENSLFTVYLNGKDMEHVVTLDTPQSLIEYARFSEVHLLDSIVSSGLVNGVVIEEAIRNTMKITGNQYIETPLRLETCTVKNSLEILNLLNGGVDLRDIATLNEVLVFNSPVSFARVSVDNLYTNDTVSGIDFNSWQENSLLAQDKNDIIVTGNWTANNLHVGSATFINNQRTTDLPVDKVQEEIDQAHHAYSNLCQKAREFVKKSQNTIFFLKYFEKSFTFEEIDNIHGIFFFQTTTHLYVVVNVKCVSKISLWDPKTSYLKTLTEFVSGRVEELIALPVEDDNTIFVTRGPSHDVTCPRANVNSWQFINHQVSHLWSFNDSAFASIHRSSSKRQGFYAIDEGSGSLLQLAPNSSQQLVWNLPVSEFGAHRFLPSNADLGVAIANGQQLIILKEPPNQQFRYKRDVLIKRLNLQNYEVEPKAKNFTFSDFRHVTEKILRDLIRRLNIQLAEIDLALSVDDLHEEHLQREFIDVLNEIRNQNILPQESFAGLDLERMEVFLNASEIPAAKLIHAIWPVFVEIEEIHSYLRSEDHDHPICGRIFNSLALVVHDILKIITVPKTDSGNVTDFKAFIPRIQTFQQEILRLIDSLDDHEHKPDNTTDTPPSSLDAPDDDHFNSLSQLDGPYIGQATPKNNLFVADNTYLPARHAGEIVAIKTGMAGNYRTLIAITEPKENAVAGDTDAVKVYFDVVSGRLYQTLAAYKPSCLTAVRVQDESLLAFVEDKLTIRILMYKGIQGFVEVVKFKPDEQVTSLNFVRAPASEECGCQKTFLVMISDKRAYFYEAIMAGQCKLETDLECISWET